MNISEKADKYIMPTYGKRQLTLVKGEGCRVNDDQGKSYLDFLSGLGVNNVGHCNPDIVAAATEQLGKLIHTSNLYYTAPQADLAEMLVEKTFADQVFFCNSGAEANEAAIKLIRKYASENGFKGSPEIISMYGSFHGRTMATISATGQPKYQEGFEPLLPGFKFVPFNDLDAVRKAVNHNTIGLMVEPVQGEGGVNIPPVEYLKGLREICDEHKILLFFDEVQCGTGRTGHLFAYQKYGVVPDILTVAKGLGGGLPIGAMLAGRELTRVFVPGTHASTFGGNPVVCAAGCAVMRLLFEGGLLENARRMGTLFVEKLEALVSKLNLPAEIGGCGLMIRIKLPGQAARVFNAAREKGLLLNAIGADIVRILPPLIVSETEIDESIAILETVLAQIGEF